jgi:predicted NUDIX family phosphoesterase
VLANGHSCPPSLPGDAPQGPQETHQGTPEEILCFPTAILEDLSLFSPGPFCGFRTDAIEMVGRLFVDGIRPGDFRPRTPDLERDTAWTQVIAVAVPWHASSRQVWTYRRGGTEGRLSGKLSCLIGGHISLNDAYPIDLSPEARMIVPPVDLLDVAFLAAIREMGEEAQGWSGNWKSHHSDIRLTLMGVVHDTSDEVGRVHLGILYRLDVAKLKIPIEFAAGSGKAGDWVPCGALAHPSLDMKVETWSHHVARHLYETSPVRTTT